MVVVVEVEVVVVVEVVVLVLIAVVHVQLIGFLGCPSHPWLKPAECDPIFKLV